MTNFNAFAYLWISNYSDKFLNDEFYQGTHLEVDIFENLCLCNKEKTQIRYTHLSSKVYCIYMYYRKRDPMKQK